MKKKTLADDNCPPRGLRLCSAGLDERWARDAVVGCLTIFHSALPEKRAGGDGSDRLASPRFASDSREASVAGFPPRSLPLGRSHFRLATL